MHSMWANDHGNSKIMIKNSNCLRFDYESLTICFESKFAVFLSHFFASIHIIDFRFVVPQMISYSKKRQSINDPSIYWLSAPIQRSDFYRVFACVYSCVCTNFIVFIIIPSFYLNIIFASAYLISYIHCTSIIFIKEEICVRYCSINK